MIDLIPLFLGLVGALIPTLIGFGVLLGRLGALERGVQRLEGGAERQGSRVGRLEAWRTGMQMVRRETGSFPSEENQEKDTPNDDGK